MNRLLIMVMLLANVAIADTFTWTVPTTRANGAPLSLAEIAGYRIQYKADTDVVYQSIDVTPGTITSAVIPIPTGKTYSVVQIATLDTNGLLSDWTPFNAALSASSAASSSTASSAASSSVAVSSSVASVAQSTTPNIALGKTVTTSADESASLTGANAVDGDTTTRWASSYADANWISIDLGSQFDITGVKLNWETAYGKSYQLQSSNDGVTWNTVYSTSTGAGGIENITISTSARYIKLNGILRGTSWGYSLWEFEVYGNASLASSSVASSSVASSSVASSSKSSSVASSSTPTSSKSSSVSSSSSVIAVSYVARTIPTKINPGLLGTYYTQPFTSPYITSLTQVNATLAIAKPSATFTANVLNYYNAPNMDNLYTYGNLRTFLRADGSSLNTDPATAGQGAIIHLVGYVNLTAGNYSFKVTGDDGYSIRLNQKVVAEHNANSAAVERTHPVFNIPVTGYYAIDVKYWDVGGNYVLGVKLANSSNGVYSYLTTGDLFNF